ncbi:chemotaxis protein CheW [Pelagibaculum spongiae]|uniref:Chemotaxis protein CheW n=2 Tax=Pelagibaculum spongiae TaxID=2080658 RepID=A0A2V1H247_9GAMM|nr:chemotaxis protein CheW [Pelagibaculum spongiae]
MSSLASQSQGLLLFQLSPSRQFAMGTLKIREIIPWQKVRTIPYAHPCIIGATHIRGMTISIIDMAASVGYLPISEQELNSCSIIITDCSRQTVGFLVRQIDQISQCQWKNIEPPPLTVGKQSYIVGVTQIDNKLIQMIDLEQLLETILPTPMNCNGNQFNQQELEVLRSLQILVADDSAVALRQLSGALEMAGVPYQMANNGKQALDIMKTAASAGQPIDILVSDIEMPGLDGYEVAFEVRSNPSVADAYIILHTSLSSEISVDRAHQIGADEALTKFDAEELVQAILRGARGHQPVEQLI